MFARASNPFLIAFVLLAYAFILVPILLVVPISLNPHDSFAIPLDGLSLRWYAALAENQDFIHSLVNVSLPAGFVTVLCATSLGTLSAIAIVRFRLPGRRALEAYFLSPLVFPHILLGASLYIYFARLGVNASFLTLIFGHILIATPYVVRNVIAGLSGLDRSIEEAAINLGANRVRAFFLVAVPQLKSSLVSSAVFAFVASFSDVNLALFLSGPNSATLPVYLFSQIQWESDPSLAAASVVQMGLVVVLILAIRGVFRLRNETR
jgi:putative spermidine/putrescine transport system permease protein